MISYEGFNVPEVPVRDDSSDSLALLEPIKQSFMAIAVRLPPTLDREIINLNSVAVFRAKRIRGNNADLTCRIHHPPRFAGNLNAGHFCQFRNLVGPHFLAQLATLFKFQGNGSEEHQRRLGDTLSDLLVPF